MFAPQTTHSTLTRPTHNVHPTRALTSGSGTQARSTVPRDLPSPRHLRYTRIYFFTDASKRRSCPHMTTQDHDLSRHVWAAPPFRCVCEKVDSCIAKMAGRRQVSRHGTARLSAAAASQGACWMEIVRGGRLR